MDCHAAFEDRTGSSRYHLNEAALFRPFEAVHSRLPLQADDRAFGWLQQRKRTEQGQRQPYNELEPFRRRVSHFHGKDRRHDGVADHDNHEIGWKIVGAVMVEFLTAFRTVIGDLQEAPEPRAFSAVRTSAATTPPRGLGQWNRVCDGHRGTPWTALVDPYNKRYLANIQNDAAKLYGMDPYNSGMVRPGLHAHRGGAGLPAKS